MGSLRLTLCAGVVVAAVLTPTAYAADAQGVVLTPASPAPGTDIRLAVGGCSGTTATAASAAFVADAWLVGKDGVLTGDTRVRSTLTPGMYIVSVGCGERQVKGVLTVGGPTAPASTGTVPPGASAAAVSPGASAWPSGFSSPVAPVSAGGGGTAHFASVDAREAGPGTRQAVIGLALAGVAAVVVAVRSARRGRSTE